MAISVVGSVAAAANNPLSGNFALPGSWQQDDLAIFWWYGRVSGKTFVDASGGNITILHNNAATNGVMAVGYRVLQTGDLAANMDWTSGNSSGASIAYGTIILRGAVLVSPVEANSGIPASFTNTGLAPNPPSVVVATTGACVITVFGKNNDYTTITPPAGYTIAGSAEDTAGTDGSGGCAYLLNVSSGTADPGAWTLGGLAADDGRTWTASIKPAVGAELAASVTLAIAPVTAALTTAITLASSVAVSVTATADLTTPVAALGFGTAPFGAYPFGHSGAVAPPPAVTVVDTPTISSVGIGTSLTFAHTTGSTATGLFVGVATETNVTVTSVTFHGDALTVLWDLQSTGVISSAGYLMVAPDIGTFDVVVTISGVTSFAAGAVSLAGLDQTTPTRTAATGSDGASGPSVTVASVAGDLVIDCAGTYNATIAVGGGQTALIDVDNAGGGGRSWGISTEIAVGTTATMAWTGGTFNVNGAVALVAAAVSTGAELEANPVLAITATGTLTTEIRLSAAPTLTVTTAGQLTTAITLAATPSLSLTTAAALTTEIRLAAVPTVRVTTTAALTTEIHLAATATVQVSAATGSLTTEIRLAASPTLQVTTAASLTTEIRLVAAAMVQITTTADLTAASPILLQGSAVLAVTTAGALTTEIRFASAVSLTVSTAPASLTTEIRLAATPLLQVTTAAALTTAIPLAGAAILAMTTSAPLTTAIPLAAGVTAAVTATGSLTTAIALAATATVSVTTSAALTAIPAGLGAAATLRITTAASLTTAIQMAGAATLAVTSSANLSVAAGLAAQATVHVTTSASLTTYTPLTATATLTIATTADLFAESAPMVGAVTLRIITAADLTTELHLAGNVLLVVLAEGVLGSIPPSIVNPSVRVVKPGRTTVAIPSGRASVVTGVGRAVRNDTGPRTAARVPSSRETRERIP